MPKNIRNILIANEEGNYGDSYKLHCLEIYKLYVEKADAISARRQSSNSFFLTINTTIIGISAYLASSSALSLALGLAGIVLSYFWYRLVLSYKQLNSGKFRVIHEIEKELPLSPYDAEWVAIGEGKDHTLYKPITDIEIKVPFVFMIFHFLIIIYVLIRCFF